jgi:CPA1 family monovalent cation:H+ antiporter
MIEILSIALIIILFSRIVEDKFNIPITLTLIFSTLILNYLEPSLFTIDEKAFDEILYIMLPVILLPDVLNLSLKELGKYSKMFFNLAFIAVVLSILFATVITFFVGTDQNLTFSALLMLFTILMATDAITVSSVFSKFALPHKLKIYAEGESLFNDVTALILFYFVAIPMLSGDTLSILQVNIILFKVVVLSILVGFICGYIGYLIIKLLNDTIEQFITIYLIVISSFIIAEHFHIAGILSIVVSVLTFKYYIQKDIEHKEGKDNNLNIDDNRTKTKKEKLKNALGKISHLKALSKKDYRNHKKSAHFIGIFANAFVFIAMVSTINIDMLIKYQEEIIFVFVLTSVTRYIFMTFILRTEQYPYRWSNALTLAGAKGGLAVIMAHSIPYNFEHRELFISIVTGIVILGTFIYTFLLMYYIKVNKMNFILDNEIYKDGVEHKNIDLVNLDIEEFKKDNITNAYKEAFVEDMITQTIKENHNSEYDFSHIMIEIVNFKSIRKSHKNIILNSFGQIVNQQLKSNYIFGKLEDNIYTISLPKTQLRETVIWLKRLEKELSIVLDDDEFDISLDFGITSSDINDTFETILEKLIDALSDEDRYKIEL